MTVLIKRYANRKLYNTQTSRYITLKGIAALLEHDEDVRVIDNETGEDITSIALSQILVDSERGGPTVPSNVLTDLIQRGGDALYGALKRGASEASDGVGGIQKNVRRILRTSEDEGVLPREWWGRADAEHAVQTAVERVFKLLDLPRRSDIEVLNQSLERVAKALETLETARSHPPGEASASAEPDEEPT